MKIIFLMGGKTIDHGDDQYPIYMVEMNEEIILEKQLRFYKTLEPNDLIFCLKTEDVKKFNADSVIKQSANDAICVEVHGKTQGSVCTALLATEFIDCTDEVILVAADELITANLNEILSHFRAEKYDAGVIAFHSVHPRYSFARLDDNGLVCEVAEKRPISKNALASFYYFKSGHDFIECAKNVIRKDSKVNDGFYLSQTINEMILRQKAVGIGHIDNKEFFPLKSEMQLAQYMQDYWEQRENI